MGRVDYYKDPDAPSANSLVPGASGVVTDDEGRILLQRRSDTGRWALPGGVMDIGETIAQAIVREVREETGLEVKPEYLVGIYTDPGHVLAYDDGEVRQEFSICFACTVTGGELHPSEESLSLAFVPPEDIPGLDVHPSIGLRIQHFLEHHPRPVIA